MISVENIMYYTMPTKTISECFLLEEDIKIVKSEVLKCKKITDKTKINLLKMVSLQLFFYESFIHETTKLF